MVEKWQLLLPTLYSGALIDNGGGFANQTSQRSSRAACGHAP